MQWSLMFDGEQESFESRQDLLDRVRDLFEDYLATSPLADAEVRDPFGNELAIELGLRLAELED